MKMLFAVLLAFVLGNSWAAESFDGAPLKGEVLETVDAGAYTYLRLKTSDGEIWAAVVQAPIRKGAQVTIQDPMLMEQFESKSLHRTFDRIVFGSLADTGVAASPAAEYMSAHAGAAGTVDAPVEKLDRAAGPDARTVAEVFAQKGQLKGKNVMVRGKVVKFSASIMDRNWLHLRDGSGSAADASNDLLVTTKQVATVGDVLVVQGVVRTDVDYGAGYAYPVIVEDATLKQ